MAISHPLAANAAFERGRDAENAFAAEIKALGWGIRPATPDEERRHVDFHLSMPKGKCKVDVKAKKEIYSIIGGILRKDVLLLELTNVSGGKGWLYGDAHYIVQQEPDGGWTWYDREKLVTIVERLVEKNKFVDSFQFSHRCIYRRRGRADRITTLTLKEVKEAIVMEWEPA